MNTRIETADMLQPPSQLLSPLVLPQELIVKVLIRLPVRSLMRFRCVCKLWKTLIFSPQFVKGHLHNSISDTSMTHQRLALLTYNYEYYKMETCSMRSLFDHPSASPETLSFNVEFKHQFIIGSCNGLLCLCDSHGNFILSNPSTRLASKRLPPTSVIGVLPDQIRYYGFGYDQVNDNYKVLITYGFPEETKVHTFGTNFWTTVQNSPALYWRDMFGKFVSGTLNWLAKKCDVIISFDMERETYGEAVLPPQLDGDLPYNHVLDVLSDCLCFSYSNQSHRVVWLMKKYGVQESWTKLMLIPHEGIIATSFHPLCISEDGVVLAKCHDVLLVMYNPNGGTLDYPMVKGRYGRDIHIYHESLVSPISCCSQLLSLLVLPEELIVKILVRLPVRSLLQFRCVCKFWKTLIFSPQFVKDHLQHSISDTSMTHQRLAFLTNKYKHYKMATCSMQSLFNHPSASPGTLNFNVELKHQFIIGSCNGLLCLCDSHGYFILRNPSTKLTSKRFPPTGLIGVSPHKIKYYGFGYDQVNDNYKVLITYGFPEKTKVHTFGTNFWTTVQNSPALYWRDMFGKFVSGTLNWLAKKCDVIISFDMERETYGVALLPPQLDGDLPYNHVLDVLSDCLCFSYSNRSHRVVWLMKKYGVQESWTKLMLIPDEVIVTMCLPSFHPLCILENGVVLARCHDVQLVMYNPNSGMLGYPKIEGRYGRDIHIYHESLVSPISCCSQLLSPLVLPQELIVKILIRLSVRSLMRFRCVCKLWKTLIFSPQFVKGHLHNSISDTSMTHQRLALLTYNYEYYKMETCSMRSLFDHPSASPETLSFNVEFKHQFIIGSCNGLLCLCDSHGNFILRNPSTRLASKRLPPTSVIGVLPDQIRYYGFGYDQVNDNYKVLITYGFPEETKVHTFGTNFWTTVQNSLALYWRDMFGKFVSGTLNWLAKKCDVIISFDMERETYGEAVLPPQLDGDLPYNHVLDVLSDCLCFSYSNQSHRVVWLMKKYGVQESWTKLMLIPHEGIITTSFHPLCISEDGVVLAKCHDVLLVMYNPNGGTLDYPMVEGRYGRDIHIYHESLVSPI